jgi:1,2-diacylglycerol-3-alpha-glucose alpha-1,2-glucosyltransferase
MKAYVYFDPGRKWDVFEGARLRKNIKGALELADVPWVQSIFAAPDILHVLSCDDENKVHDAKEEGIKVVVSACYCERDPSARFFNQDSQGYYVLKLKAERVLEAADLILVPTKMSENALRQCGIKNPAIKILSPGVNLARFEDSDPIERDIFYRYFRFPSTTKFVISLGNYEDNQVVSSFLSIAKMVPSVRFFFIGGARKNIADESLSRKLNKEAPANVRFSDFLEDDVYRSGMMGAAVYLSFAQVVPDPMIVLEAMASKTQIISLGKPLGGEFLIDKKTAYVCLDETKAGQMIESYCLGKLAPTIIEGYRVARASSLSVVGRQLKAYYESVIKDSEE